MSDESLLWQLLSLRLAVIACHARGVTEPKALSLRRSGREIVLNLPKALPDTQPRALYLLQEEAQAWARSEVLELRLAT